MRLRETALVAVRELKEAVRGRWFVAAAGAFLALSLALSWMGLAGAQRSGLAGFDRTTASLLNLALLFVPLVTLSLGALAVAGELEDGSLAMLLAQPITRAEAWCGKLLGLLLAVWAAILAGFGGTGVIVGIARGGDARGFLQLVALMLLYGAATLALGVLLSIALRSRVRAVGAAFVAWITLVYLSDLGTMGLAVTHALGPAQVFALALLNPVEQARLAGTLALTDRLEILGPVGLYGLDHLGARGMTLLALALLVSLAAGLALVGYRIFRKAVLT